jgi:hypothetical protein
MDRIKLFTHLTEEQIRDVFVYYENWNTHAFYDGYKKPWDVNLFHYINSPFTQVLAALKKCAEFQAAGGNCAMILPTISLVNCKLYKECIKNTTIRIDLPLFPFDGFKNPLMKHICLLYFLQPAFLNNLMVRNRKREIEVILIPLKDNTKIRISHLAAPYKTGGKKKDLTEKERV